MKFYSTNRKSNPVNFQTALLTGLAADGGLYIPEVWRKIKNLTGKNQKFGNIALEILEKFIDIPGKELKGIIKNAFNFKVPLIKLGKNLYVLELFHGPTLSFKDFGARFMARIMNYFLKKSSQKLNIIVATSGDTGGAVAQGFYGLSNIKVYVLYPSKRISGLQEKQIATLGKNITALEVKGDFDDCQRLAKTALSDQELRRKINISSANSINIGRLLPQMVYYFYSFQQFQSLYSKSYILNPIYVVPSGNFGNLAAGIFAKRSGLAIKKFIAAVNLNSGVPVYLKSGHLPKNKTIMTLSNAMDVGNPSNWARILDLYGHNRRKIKRDLEAIMISETKTKKIIRDIYKKYNYVIDPHTAVGVAAALRQNQNEAKIVLATAHPAKFKNIVEKIIGVRIELPPTLRKIINKKKKSVILENNYAVLKKLLFH